MSGIRASLVAAAVIASLGGVGPASGQTVPNQASQRGDIGSGLGQTSLPKGGVFQPRVSTAVQYAANINLAPDGSPQIDTAGIELAPGFYASYSTGSVLAAIDYSLIGRAWEDSDFNDVSHNLAANGEWLAVPEWFTVRGQAGYQDGIIDPSDGLNYGGLGIFGPSNLQEVANASVTPILQHRFNDFQFAVQYDYGRTWYLDQGKGQPVVGFVNDQDSTDQSASVTVGTANDGARLSGQIFYDWQKSEFDTALPYQFERAGLDIGLQVASTLRLVGDVGVESDVDASTTEGGLDSDFWSAGVNWTPNDRTSVEARVGERFFGTSYSFSASHRARLLQIAASYSEDPSVETRQLSLGEFNPGELPPGAPDIGVGRLNSTPFVGRNAQVSVTAAGSRTELSLTAFWNERDYLRGFLSDETDTGVTLGATRQLASNLSADFSVTYSDFERLLQTTDPEVVLTTGDYDTQALVRLNRTSGKSLTLSGEAGYLTRAGDIKYDGWWAAIRATWSP